MRDHSANCLVSVSLLLLTTLFTGLASASHGIGTGPPVDPAFAATSFDVAGQPDAVFLAWRDGQAQLRSGLLQVDDGTFLAFPVQPIPQGYMTNLAVGAGGPPADRHAYIAWVGNQLNLLLLVLDANGSSISSPQSVSSSVQVVPVRIAGTDSGALISYAWDGNPFWDPRVLTVDLSGHVLGEEVVGGVVSPEQTLGVDIAATPAGPHAVVYIASDTGSARIRRYDAGGAVDPTPVEFFGDAGADYLPHAALFSPAGGDPFLLLALPSLMPGNVADLRLAHATLALGDVTLGPGLSELVPAFPGAAEAVAGLAGRPEHVVVLWQEIERQENCGCSVPPPVRIEFIAQLLLATNPPAAVGEPFSVYLWQEGDPTGPPVTAPIVVASTRTPGQFTVLWSDGLLRHETIGVLGPVELSMEESQNGTVARWTTVLAAESYNVIRGQLNHIADTGSSIDVGPVVCIEAGSIDTEGFPDSALPDPGEAYFYLAEAVYADGSRSSYGASSTGKPRVPGPGACQGLVREGAAAGVYPCAQRSAALGRNDAGRRVRRVERR